MRSSINFVSNWDLLCKKHCSLNCNLVYEKATSLRWAQIQVSGIICANRLYQGMLVICIIRPFSLSLLVDKIRCRESFTTPPILPKGKVLEEYLSFLHCFFFRAIPCSTLLCVFHRVFSTAEMEETMGLKGFFLVLKRVFDLSEIVWATKSKLFSPL